MGKDGLIEVDRMGLVETEWDERGWNAVRWKYD